MNHFQGDIKRATELWFWLVLFLHQCILCNYGNQSTVTDYLLAEIMPPLNKSDGRAGQGPGALGHGRPTTHGDRAGMNRTPDTFATLPRDEMAALLAHAYAVGFDRAACDAALSHSKPLPEWCRAEVLLHHDMSRQIFTHVPLRDGRSVAATCKAWACTFWLQESTADADWVITHQGGILQLVLPSLKSTRKPSLQGAEDGNLPLTPPTHQTAATMLAIAQDPILHRRRYLVGRTRTLTSVNDEEWLKTHVEPKLKAHVADAFIGLPSDVELPEVERPLLPSSSPWP